MDTDIIRLEGKISTIRNEIVFWIKFEAKVMYSTQSQLDARKCLFPQLFDMKNEIQNIWTNYFNIMLQWKQIGFFLCICGIKLLVEIEMKFEIILNSIEIILEIN